MCIEKYFEEGVQELSAVKTSRKDDQSKSDSFD